MANRKARDDQFEESQEEMQDGLDAQTVALRVIAGLLLLGAASMLSILLVPFVLAVVAAIAFSPFAGRLERWGLPRALSSLACVVFMALALLSTAGLLAYQAGQIFQESDKYLKRFSELLGEASEALGGDRLLVSIGMIEPGITGGEVESEGPDAAVGEPIPVQRAREAEERADRDAEEQAEAFSGNTTEFWSDYLRRNLQTIGGWIIGGIGGFIGVIGQTVIFLAFSFYMLMTREEWIERMVRAASNLGLRPRRGILEKVQEQIRKFLLFICLVALGYAIIITILGFVVGLPSPPLWGLLTGLLVFIPYIGPVIAGALLTFVALASSDGLWQPATVLGVYLLLQTIESYLIAPLIYGRAVKFNPVTVLFAVLFFGWLWGPLGLVAALPVMVLLRAIVNVTPDTPALQALMEKQKAGAT
ncbi:hypothetical protein BH23PLA1_BH23PLA1_03800 [soil metagenome]